MIKSPLKWAGSKQRLIPFLRQHLDINQYRLVEPFVGSASVALNLDFSDYLLCDNNQDLINLYTHIQQNTDQLLQKLQGLFVPINNTRSAFEALRARFNSLPPDHIERAALFIYLNRHCFNGLCRYNKSGGFNVSFGKYKKPYLPVKEILFFAERFDGVRFKHQCFEETFAEVGAGDMVYCDPPYVPLTSNFNYTSDGFGYDEQVKLKELAKESQAIVYISNHDCEITRELYSDADGIMEVKVNRSISRDGNGRGKVGELLVVYG